MKKQIIFMIVCLSVAILFGCQPTPEGPGPVAGHTSQAYPGRRRACVERCAGNMHNHGRLARWDQAGD